MNVYHRGVLIFEEPAVIVPRENNIERFDMKLCKYLGASAAATLLGTTATFADVTAREVWSDWSGYLSSFGYQISAEEQGDGKTLKIIGFTAINALPDDSGQVVINLPDLELTNRGDGTVSVSMAQHNPFMLDITPKDGEPVHLELDFFQTGLSMIVSGTADEMTYASTASEIGIGLQKLTVDGKPLPNAKFLLTGKDFIGKYVSRLGNLRVIEQQGAFGSLEYVLAFSDPNGSGGFDGDGVMQNVTYSGQSQIPTSVDFSNLANAIRNGFSGSGSFSYASSSGGYKVDDNGKITSSQSSSGEGSLEFELGEKGVMYGARSKDTKITMSIPELPFPELAFAVAESGAKIRFPVMKSEDPQDYAFAIKFLDLALPDEIWGMADPMGALPHDPVTLALDISGQAKLNFDIFDPKAAEEMGNQPPGEIETIDLNTLLLKLAGAELSGNGHIRIDNEDLASYGGTPKPVGEINLMLVGGNALLDKLVQMGLVPEDQAMGFRMMLGMFAQPGDGEDVLVSKIEFTEDGQVLANGQRLK